MAYSSPVQHQDFQAIPKLDTPFIDAAGNISIPWYRLLISLWSRTAGSFVQTSLVQVVQNVSGTPTLIEAATGKPMGPIATGASTNTVIQLVLPADQPRSGFVPPMPVDQLHPAFPVGAPMDQLQVNPIVNLTLELGAP